jgi:hypothetical protein
MTLSEERLQRDSMPINAVFMLACFGALALNACLDDRPLSPLRVVFFDGGAAGDDNGTSGEGGGSSADAGAPPTGGVAGGGAAGDGGRAALPTGGGGAGNASGTGGAIAGQAGFSGGGVLAAGGSAGQQLSQAGACGCSGTGSGGCAPGRCPDLDGNTVLDCDETMIKNPSFDGSMQTQNWVADSDLELRWHADDAHGYATSGSLIVENQAEYDQDNESMLGARQCVPVTAGAIYHFASEISVPDDAGEGRGGIQITVYDVPACVGDIVEAFTTNTVKGSAWKVTQVTYIAPPLAKSLAMRLVAVKPFRDPPLAVSFDNVLVRTE